MHPQDWYAEHRIESRIDTTATAIDRRAHEVVTAEGGRLRYDKLLLTTGATPRRLSVPGSDLAGVHYLRTLDDSTHLRTAFRPGSRVVIIGAGWIGLETAAAARAAGAEVTAGSVVPADGTRLDADVIVVGVGACRTARWSFGRRDERQRLGRDDADPGADPLRRADAAQLADPDIPLVRLVRA